MTAAARALVAVLVAAIGPGCAGVPEPKTVAQARPELAVAYEAALLAHTYLDGRNAALYEQRARATAEAIEAHVEEFTAECGAQAVGCMHSAYLELMAEWERDSGWAKRTAKLELARKGLAAMRAILETDPNGDLKAWAPAVISTLSALGELAAELEKSGVKLPPAVSEGIAALRRLA